MLNRHSDPQVSRIALMGAIKAAVAITQDRSLTEEQLAEIIRETTGGDEVTFNLAAMLFYEVIRSCVHAKR